MRDYPNTYYSATRRPAADHASLRGTVTADVCVIGGGLAGLSTAWELIRRGRSVALLEAQRIGWGASGRNGGFVLQGWSEGLRNIEARCGRDHARALFGLSVEGVEIVRDTINGHSLPGCNPTTGKLGVTRYEAADQLQRHRDHMARTYGYEFTYIDRPTLRGLLKSDIYFQALRDPVGFHFHPLNYCLGLADLIVGAGGRLFEDTTMIGMSRTDTPGPGGRWRVDTVDGSVMCHDVVMCGGGYGGPEFGPLRRAFLPIATYVVLTERLGDRLADFVATTDAVGDDRRSSDYYRIVDGDRLLWGGRITTRHEQDEKRLAAMLRRDISGVFPGLADVRIEKAWSGLMGYARHKMPHIAKVEEGLWSCSSFGGHGMNTAPIGGRVVAEAITGESDRIRFFAPYGLTWNGGIFGPPAAELVYAGLRLMDFWQESRSRRHGS